MIKSDLERNNLIFNLYFENKLTASEISKKVSLSISQISRILSVFPLYNQEKTRRIEENRIKHNEQAKKIMRDKRIKEKDETKTKLFEIYMKDWLESYKNNLEDNYKTESANVLLNVLKI